MMLEILTPKGVEFNEKVKRIILPTKMGQICVLPNHEPMIAVLEQGRMEIISDAGETSRDIEGGILEIIPDKAVILLKKF